MFQLVVGRSVGNDQDVTISDNTPLKRIIPFEQSTEQMELCYCSFETLKDWRIKLGHYTEATFTLDLSMDNSKFMRFRVFWVICGKCTNVTPFNTCCVYKEE